MIHSTAIIDKSAVIGQNVDIGPYVVIGENVTIGDGTTIGAASRFSQEYQGERLEHIYPFLTPRFSPSHIYCHTSG